MDAFTLAIGALSIGIQAYGAQKQVSATKDYANTVNPLYAAKSQQDIRIAGNEQKISQQNQNWMELQSHRQSLQNLRKAQQASSEAKATAASQGALFGSGAKGGQAQIKAEEATNQAALSQGLQVGRNIFGYNTDITGARIAQYGIETNINQAESNYKVSQAEASGFSNIGKSLGSALSLFKSA